MSESITKRMLETIRAHPEGMRQRHIAQSVGTSAAWVRQKSLEFERKGLVKIVETDAPSRRIMIYPVVAEGGEQ